jgi:oligopeptide transport system ATP-binding protein
MNLPVTGTVMDNQKLLEVKDLTIQFSSNEGIVHAANGVSYHVNKGETLGIVGESGCGKSVSALSILRLIPCPPARIVSGEILFDGMDLLKLRPSEIRALRGKEIAMIYQEPMTALNPVFTTGFQIGEAMKAHRRLSWNQAMQRAKEIVKMVGIPVPERRVKEYPHQFSGGMKQRVMIGMSLALSPKLIICDEPTTALDVTIQAQILDLLRNMKKELGISILFITHDLGVVAEMADRVAVMYAGKVVEEAGVRQLFENPLHPYTEGLLKSMPSVDRPKERLITISGAIPNPLHLPGGCKFNPRCSYVSDKCKEKEPPYVDVNGEQFVRCWLPSKEGVA